MHMDMRHLLACERTVMNADCEIMCLKVLAQAFLNDRNALEKSVSLVI
jgi:hypothetical protein